MDTRYNDVGFGWSAGRSTLKHSSTVSGENPEKSTEAEILKSLQYLGFECSVSAGQPDWELSGRMVYKVSL